MRNEHHPQVLEGWGGCSREAKCDGLNTLLPVPSIRSRVCPYTDWDHTVFIRDPRLTHHPPEALGAMDVKLTQVWVSFQHDRQEPQDLIRQEEMQTICHVLGRYGVLEGDLGDVSWEKNSFPEGKLQDALDALPQRRQT
eukprot:5779424-Amphidinium_carterae.2